MTITQVTIKLKIDNQFVGDIKSGKKLFDIRYWDILKRKEIEMLDSINTQISIIFEVENVEVIKIETVYIKTFGMDFDTLLDIFNDKKQIDFYSKYLKKQNNKKVIIFSWNKKSVKDLEVAETPN